MENKQAVAVAVGVGAVGTALAYLGYSAYQKKDKLAEVETEQIEEKASWLSNLWNKSDEKESLYNEVDEEEKTDDVQLKAALKEEEANIKIKAAKSNSAWGKFWHDSHQDMKKEKNEDN
tara:strand:+ start:150 stop:506 length:357 start_codon:yes stop_codon:yes gene_type:complete